VTGSWLNSWDTAGEKRCREKKVGSWVLGKEFKRTNGVLVIKKGGDTYVRGGESLGGGGRR